MSSLGKDLASIRKSKHLTLEDIQNAIKIPVHTLKSIEDDSIYSQSSQSPTYIRSFIRSYARFLKIDDEVIIRALDAVEEGRYSGQLLGKSAPDTKSSDNNDTYEAEDPAQFADPASYDEPAEVIPPSDAPSYEADIEDTEKRSKGSYKATSSRSPVQSDDSIDWAEMGNRFKQNSGSSKSWIIILAIVIIAGLGISIYVYSAEIAGLFTSDTEEQIAETWPENESDSQAVLTDSTTLANQNMAQDSLQASAPELSPLPDTLTVAVYAAYGILEPVRVTSDFNWRTNPFWMEQGLAYNFDFRDSLLVRGTYSYIELLYNGHVIDNPRQNFFSEEYNSILITRSILDQARYRAEPPAEFPLDVAPPDSIVYRISF